MSLSECQLAAHLSVLVARDIEMQACLTNQKDMCTTLEAVDRTRLQHGGSRALEEGLGTADGGMAAQLWQLVVDTAKPGWPLVYASGTICNTQGGRDVLGQALWDAFTCLDAHHLHFLASKDMLPRCFELPAMKNTTSANIKQLMRLHFSLLQDLPADVTVAVPTLFDDNGGHCGLGESLYLVTVDLKGTPQHQVTTSSTSSTISSTSSSSSKASSSSKGSGKSTSQRLTCEQLPGLVLGSRIASGSYGRVYSGKYLGAKVAVKVLDSSDIPKRDVRGLPLEGVLVEGLNHPNIVRVLCWGQIHGQAMLPPKKRTIGESWDSSSHSINGPTSSASLSDHRTFSDSPSSSESIRKDSYCDGSSSPRDEGGGQTWLVMELCDMGCLQDALDRGLFHVGPSRSPNLMAIAATAHEIAAGLRYLHRHGIVHGDLSAFNVLLTAQGATGQAAGRGFSAKLADFGLARDLSRQSRIATRTYGTITHMAPELLMEGHLSKAADVYSFGVLLWQLCCSCRAWGGMSHGAVVNAVCYERLQLLFPEDSPEGFIDLAQACMAFNAEDRPACDDIIDILLPLGQL